MNTLKETTRLTRRHADELIQASGFANHISCPLNIAVTIHWALAGGPGDGNSRARQSRLFVRLSHWLWNRNAPWAAIWVREAGKSGKDVHTHIAMHLPRHIPVADLEAYLRAALQTDEPNVLDVQRCADRQRGFVGWRRYMLKALEPDLQTKYGIPRNAQFGGAHQGAVFGKRAGSTLAIGPTARRRSIDDVKLMKAA